MKLLSWPRRSGKTTYLINKAKKDGAVVITHNRQLAKMLREQFEYPLVYGGLDEYRDATRGRLELRNAPVYIDELELVLGFRAVLATTTDRDIEREQFELWSQDETV